MKKPPQGGFFVSEGRMRRCDGGITTPARSALRITLNPSLGAAMRRLTTVTLAACGLMFAAVPFAHADTLLVDRVKQETGIPKPARGMSMAQVERTFGAPQSRLDPRGGQKSQWPTINRWVYPAYIVYFERNKVIDVVLTRATAMEVAPAPPIR